MTRTGVEAARRGTQQQGSAAAEKQRSLCQSMKSGKVCHFREVKVVPGGHVRMQGY